MKKLSLLLLSFSISLVVLVSSRAQDPSEAVIRIASKKFNESYILMEIAAQILEDKGLKVKRRPGLGGTLIAYKALEEGEVDLYPEYTGTIQQAILKEQDSDFESIQESLGESGLEMLVKLGFNNTYALATAKSFAVKHHLKTISDINRVEWQGAAGFEFHKRADGWGALKKTYQLKPIKMRRLEQSLAYEAVRTGKVDGTIVYSTDSKIKTLNLLVLEDDKNFFPKYEAVFLVRKELPKIALRQLKRLENLISEKDMMEMNYLFESESKTLTQVASDFLLERQLITKRATRADSTFNFLVLKIKEHLILSFLALLLAVLVAVPLAISLENYPKLANLVLGFSGLLQTIPSIALLAFMIPILGIGFKPALLGLFVYSILPILRNTYVALKQIDPQLLESAKGIGLSSTECLLKVKIPLGLPVILAGIRTAAVINIGTATLAAFIGAGGLGEPIVTGLSLNNTNMILQGAIPSAILAILVEVIFERIEKKLKARIV